LPLVAGSLNFLDAKSLYAAYNNTASFAEIRINNVRISHVHILQFINDVIKIKYVSF